MPTRPDRTPASIRLSPRHERWVLGVSLALLLSGVLWLVFHFFFAVPGDFGESRHPLEAWWLRLHGAAAMASLVVLGTVLPVHVDRAWQQRRNYHTGIVLLCTAAALVVSGYALYYAGSETLRPWISIVHWVIGLAGLPAILLHVYVGKQAATRRHTARSRARRRD